jgi:hypothetical protein
MGQFVEVDGQQRAVRQVIEERFSFKYKSSSVRKILHLIGWSYQRGRKLYINRTEADQARYEFESEEVLEKYSQSKERADADCSRSDESLFGGDSFSQMESSWGAASDSRLQREVNNPRVFMVESILGQERRLRRLRLTGRTLMRQSVGMRCC